MLSSFKFNLAGKQSKNIFDIPLPCSHVIHSLAIITSEQSDQIAQIFAQFSRNFREFSRILAQSRNWAIVLNGHLFKSYCNTPNIGILFTLLKLFGQKMGWATFEATLSPSHQVTLVVNDIFYS
jgi:hypothetical protein